MARVGVLRHGLSATENHSGSPLVKDLDRDTASSLLLCRTSTELLLLLQLRYHGVAPCHGQLLLLTLSVPRFFEHGGTIA